MNTRFKLPDKLIAHRGCAVRPDYLALAKVTHDYVAAPEDEELAKVIVHRYNCHEELRAALVELLRTSDAYYLQALKSEDVGNACVDLVLAKEKATKALAITYAQT